jgi:hypothetical protein
MDGIVVNLHEKKLDDGTLILHRHPEASPREPSASVEAQGGLIINADFELSLDQAALNWRCLKKSL